MKKYLSIPFLLPKTNLAFHKVSMKIISVVTILMMVIGMLSSTVVLAAPATQEEISLQQEISPTKDSFVLRDPIVSDPVLPADTTGLPPAPAVELFDPNEDTVLVMPNARTPDDFEGRMDGPATIDPALQLERGDINMPAPIMNWEGISATGVLPPDTDGQVGPDHYVQIVNAPGVGSQVRVWNKSGTQLHNFGLGSLWPAGDPCNSSARGDPVVLYDQLADRWLLTQFALPDPPFYECIAVSKTGTPTNNPNDWHLYSFLVHNTKMNDYPKLGVWPDGYYMSANQFTTGYAGVGVWVFDRVAMLNGNPATFQYFDLASVDPNYWAFLPSNLMGSTLPPTGAPNYFASMDQNWSGSDDILHIFEFHTDWINPANTTFSLVADLLAAPFDNDLCPSVRERCIHQPDGAPQLEALSVFLMMHLWYRNFGSHESLVVNSTVDADGTGRAGIRWLEIRGGTVDTTLSDATIYQQGTYAPADGLHRWMGSIAMDKFGNMALGYSVSSTSVYPAIRYAGRFASDPLGTLPQAEVQIIAGSGVQTHSAARWGDYSAMSVDPVDDCTFWYTQEYIETTGSANWQTRIASFQFPTCSGDVADIYVDPVSFYFEVPLDGLDPAPLTIGNIGGTGLDWGLSVVTHGPEPSESGQTEIVTLGDITSDASEADLDLMTGAPYASASHKELPLISEASPGGNVLWDLTHGVYLDYEPSGRFSSLVALLNSAGFTVSTTDVGLDNVDLAPFDIVVINIGSAWNSTYTPSEVAAIETFVLNGGGLLIMGDNTDSPNGNINPIAQTFGSTCGVSYLSPLDLFITDLTPHPIFDSLGEIFFRAAGEVTTSPPSILVAHEPSGKGTVAVAEVGSGKIVVTGDTNVWENIYLTTSDNQLFAENSFNWLSMPIEPSWLSADPTSGSVPPGDVDLVDVSVDATGMAVGIYTGELLIYSNDPDESPLSVPVTMEVLPPTPDIEVDPDSLVSELKPNSVGVELLNISNVGSADLMWLIYEDLYQIVPVEITGLQNPEGYSISSDAGFTTPVQETQRKALKGINTPVNDGSFENGPPPASAWIETSSTSCEWIGDWSGIWGVAAFDGIYDFWGGGYCDYGPSSNTVSQVIEVPAMANTLSFWYVAYRGDVDDPDLDVAIVAVNGTPVWSLDLVLANNTFPDWVNVTIDLSAYAGQMVNLELAGLSAGSLTGNIRFDYLEWLDPEFCDDPLDISWITNIFPQSDTTGPGGSTPVGVTFDSGGMTDGVYDGNLCVESNDPDEALVVVPVELTVVSLPPDIEVDPPSVFSEQPPGTVEVEPLDISNIGDADLIWDIFEEELPSTPQAGKGEWLYRSEEGVIMPFNGESEALAYPSAYRWQPDIPSAPLNILVYADDYFHVAPNTFPDQALQILGLAYTAHYDDDFAGFETSLTGGTWDLVLFGNDSWAPPASVWTALDSYVNSGGMLIINTWYIYNDPANSLWSTLGFTWVGDDNDPPDPVFWWVPGHPFFNNPESVPEFTSLTDDRYGIYGEYVEPLPGFEALAGYTTPGPDPNQAAMIHGNGNRTVFKGFLDGQNDANLDADGLMDGVELWINMIAGIGVSECISGDIPWVSVDPMNGITPPGGTDTVDVIFDSTGLGAGVYIGNLCVNSNDPDESPVVVPLTLTVETEPPDIEIDPPSLFSEQPPGTVEVEPLDISNVGGKNLDWEVIEEMPSVSISQSSDDFSRGSAPPSLGLPPGSTPPESSPSSEPFEGLLAPGSDAYATETLYGIFTQFDLDIPEVLNTVSPYPSIIWAGDFLGADFTTTYAIRDDNMLVTLDTATGGETVIGAVPAPPNFPSEIYTGMAYDPTTGTMYASSCDTTVSHLYIVDLITPTTTMVGEITNSPCTIAISVDDTGQMYGNEIVNDVLISIDKATGTGTIIGLLGFDANFGQGMDFDSASGQLFLAAFNNSTYQAELRIADTTTGATALVGVLGQTSHGIAQLGWLANASGGGCIPGDIPWVSVSPTTGTTPPGGTDTLDVAFDSTGLTPGTYEGNLCVLSNDPDESLTVVPLTLETTFTTSTVGLYDYLGGNFYLRNEHAGGVADEAFRFGPKNAGWIPITGDWDNDGVDTVGLYVPISGNFYLRNEHAGGAADEAFRFGPKNAGWVPIAGDWDGDGVDTVGLYNPVGGNFYLRNSHAGGVADEVFGFGPKNAGWVPIVGDWDGDGVDTVGLYNPVGGHFYLRNAHTGGVADESFRFGAKNAGWVPIAGDWDANGIDTVGLYNPVGGNFYLKNSHTGGVADEAFRFGPKNVGWIPIAGDWDGS